MPKKCKSYERHALFNCVVYNYSKEEIATEPLDHFQIMIVSPHSHWIIHTMIGSPHNTWTISTQWLDYHTTILSFPHNFPRYIKKYKKYLCFVIFNQTLFNYQNIESTIIFENICALHFRPSRSKILKSYVIISGLQFGGGGYDL